MFLIKMSLNKFRLYILSVSFPELGILLKAGPRPRCLWPSSPLHSLHPTVQFRILVSVFLQCMFWSVFQNGRRCNFNRFNPLQSLYLFVSLLYMCVYLQNNYIQNAFLVSSLLRSTTKLNVRCAHKNYASNCYLLLQLSTVLRTYRYMYMQHFS